MAVMWPREVPNWVRMDSRRSAEVRVHTRIAEVLDADWEVYYSRPWHGVSPRGGEIDGEADFIVAHPDRGLLFLEVKGGRISFDPQGVQWYTTDRKDFQFKIKDPADQAMKCKHQIRRKLRELADWPTAQIRFRHGVVLLDTEPPSPETVALGGHERLLFCHFDRFESDFGTWIEERLAATGPTDRQTGPGIAGLACLRRLVAQPVQLRTALWADIRAEMEEQDMLLTGAQLATIAALDGTRRAVIQGGAGTGKTLLAKELGVRRADQGLNVLLLCSSRALAADLRAQVSRSSPVRVMTIAEFRSLRRGPFRRPEAARQWDVVLVDEAQDIDLGWWSDIEQAVADEGCLYVFRDSNQAVYRLDDDAATRLVADSFTLNLNLRNTREIAHVSETLYRGPLVKSAGPVGDPATLVDAGSADPVEAAVGIATSLVSDRKVAAERVAILTGDESNAEQLVAAIQQRGLRCRRLDEPGAGVIIDLVARFKGLESPVIILLMDRSLAASQELAYVGVTRARSRLWVIGNVEGSALREALLGTESRAEAKT